MEDTSGSAQGPGSQAPHSSSSGCTCVASKQQRQQQHPSPHSPNPPTRAKKKAATMSLQAGRLGQQRVRGNSQRCRPAGRMVQ